MESKAGTKGKWDKLPWWAGWALGYVGVLGLAAALVYYWRVVFSPLPIPALAFTGQIAFIFTVLYGMLIAIVKLAKGKLALQGALCVFCLGLLFCFSSGPMQVPDEHNHYLRAYSISQGNFTYEEGREFPADVSLLIEKFPSFLNHRIAYEKGEMIPSAIANYLQGVEAGETAMEKITDPIMFTILPFLPAALFMSIARLFGFGALGLLYAGRLANLVVYSLISYKVFKNCDRYRGVFMAITMLPLSLFMAASCSYDSIILALSYLIISYFCKENFNKFDLMAFAFVIIIITYLKSNNIILLAVLLLIPKSRWKTSIRAWKVFLDIAVVAGLFWLAMKYVDGTLLKTWLGEMPRGSGAADPTAQIMFILSNPFRFIAVLFFAVEENAGFLFDMGNFGWLDMAIPLVSGLSVLTLSGASALGIQQEEDTKTGATVAIGLAVVGYAGAVLAGMYVLETDLQSIRVVGAQPRYFLPAFLLLFMLCSILLGKAVKPRLSGQATLARTEQITLWMVVAVAFIGAILLFQYTFIGQWFPKGEGGWKMINMFGWQIT